MKRKAILTAVTLYFIGGLLYSAYDSHQNPERFEMAVREGLVFWNE